MENAKTTPAITETAPAPPTFKKKIGLTTYPYTCQVFYEDLRIFI
jgi:hypothetical protein